MHGGPQGPVRGQGVVLGGLLPRVTKAGRWARCQRCMVFWASFSSASKSGASYLLLMGPGPASSATETRKGEGSRSPRRPECRGRGWAACALVTQVDVAFPGQSLEAREAALEQSVPLPPVPLQPRLADLDDPTALPATTEEERGQRSAGGPGGSAFVRRFLRSLVTDDDFTVLRFAEHLEALPQHVLGHAARQVVDVKHLAVVLATEQP